MRRAWEESLDAGYGEALIDAPLGGSMPGYFRDRRATGSIDPLKAKALYIRRGREEGAIVAVDSIGLIAREVAACREAATSATSIPPEKIWIHATHTHTGSNAPRYFTADADQISPGVYSGEVEPKSMDVLREAVAKAVRSARGSAAESTVELAQGSAEGLAFYRRFRMKDGSVLTNPGRRNPEIVGPAGAVDTAVTVLRLKAAQSLVVVFGLHPDTIGGTLYSADYPHFLSERVRRELGETWNVLFLNAACGNVNHIDVTNEKQISGPDEAKRIGEALGEVVVGLLGRMEPVLDATLGFASRGVPSRLRVVSEEVVKQAEKLLAEAPEKAMSFNGLYAPAAIVLGRTAEREQCAEISALRLGSITFVGMPGEIFVELARLLAHDSPFEPTRLIGLTNGSLGYIPTRAAYDEGGYEAGYRSARFEPGTGERWVKAALGLLQQLAGLP